MRVLDLSQQLPGPYATLLLASLGAHVTKVEPIHGDAARHLDATGLVMGLRQYSYLGAMLALTLALDDEDFLADGTHRH